MNMAEYLQLSYEEKYLLHNIELIDRELFELDINHEQYSPNSHDFAKFTIRIIVEMANRGYYFVHNVDKTVEFIELTGCNIFWGEENEFEKSVIVAAAKYCVYIRREKFPSEG
jgi:hypothetical protein